MAGEKEVSSSSVGRTSKDDDGSIKGDGPSQNSDKAKEFLFHPVSASTPKIDVEKFDGKIILACGNVMSWMLYFACVWYTLWIMLRGHQSAARRNGPR